MREVVFAIPGKLSSPTGGYAYDRRLLELLPNHGLSVRHLDLPGRFPHPSRDDLDATRRALAAVGDRSALLIDGLAYGALPADVIAATRAPIVALVHHPLAFETGLSEARRAELHDSERAALALARTVIATSPSTRTALESDYGVDSTRVIVAEPGTDRVPRATGSGGTPTILAVGAVSPRKGYDVLVEALRSVTDRDWRAVIAGSLDHDIATAAALMALIDGYGFRDRVRLMGAVPDHVLAELYASADLFVLSSLYEGYGMALATAMSYGLAIVSTTAGAAAQTVPDEAALKIAPGDAAALAEAIARMLDDPVLRRSLADASWRAGQELPRWEDTAATVAAAIGKLP